MRSMRFAIVTKTFAKRLSAKTMFIPNTFVAKFREGGLFPIHDIFTPNEIYSKNNEIKPIIEW